jgi:hypothetical protein
MCRPGLGLKAPALAWLWRLGLHKMLSPALAQAGYCPYLAILSRHRFSNILFIAAITNTDEGERDKI